MATNRVDRKHPQSPSGGVARLLLNAGDTRVANDRDLFACALAFANSDAALGEDPDVTKRRGELLTCLNQYRRDPEALYDRLRGELRDELDNVRIVPEWWFGEIGGRRTVRRFDEVVPLRWPSLLAYLVMLLFDEAAPLGNDLCQCKLETCARYFLVTKAKTGRPRRDYHDDVCMFEAHARGANARVRRSRARRARKPK